MANEKRTMKAWLVREKDEFCATVVFAETRGKARALARCTDACEDVDFVRIEVSRMKECDKCYKDGKWQMDWEDPADRLVLVKDCGFYCDYDAFDLKYCADCSGKEYCDQYKDRIQEEE